ncbi:TPA: hypothetical protein ACG0HZ_004870, partial [Salmonella enterica subsp. enterica serovar Derby]
ISSLLIHAAVIDAGLPTLIETTHIFLSIAPLQKRKATSGGLAIQLKVAPGTQTVPSMEYLKRDPSVPGM